MSEDNTGLLDQPIVPSTESTNEIKQEPEVKAEVSFVDMVNDESLRDTASKFKNVDSIVKSYQHLEKKLGSKLDDLSVEDIQSLNSKFNVPEEISGYEFEESDNDFIKQMRGLVSEAKISKIQAQQFDNLLKENMDTQVKDEEFKSTMSLNEAEKELKREFGLAYGDKLEDAQLVLAELSDDAQMKRFKDKGLTSDPDFIKLLTKVADIVGEDTLHIQRTSGKFGMTPNEAETKIQAIMKEHGSGYYNKPAIRKQVQDLIRVKKSIR